MQRLFVSDNIAGGKQTVLKKAFSKPLGERHYFTKMQKFEKTENPFLKEAILQLC